MSKPTVLVVDDEESIRKTLRLCLESAGYAVTVAASGPEALAFARKNPPDLALVDLRLGGLDGVAVTQMLALDAPSTSVVVMTAYATIDSAVDAMKAGAADFITKPFTPASIKHVVARALDGARVRSELDEALRTQRRARPTGPATPTSEAMSQAYRVAERAAATDATILLLGETGTGKGLLARHIHARSPRAPRPFVTVNCAVVSPTLIESELFGHTRGAFTGADSARAGYVEATKNGTLFIDEVGDLPRELQGKLLRLLEEREYVRVGDTEPRRSEARVIAATHHDLKASVAAGTFRQDLYYRLDVVAVKLPPLRERRADIEALTTSLLSDGRAAAGRAMPLQLTPATLDALRAYDWPGNVRELSNVLERAAILATGDTLTPDLLPEEVRAAGAATSSSPSPWSDADESLEAAERRHVAAVLQRHPTLDSAARALGVDPSTLYRKRERYGLR